MGIAFNPKIVTDGLVLLIDAANKKSWTNGQVSFTDITGRGNTGQPDGLSFAENVKGTFMFNGTTNHIDVDNIDSSDIAFGTGDFAIETWVKVYNLTANHYIWDTRPYIADSDAGLAFYVNGIGNDGWVVHTGNSAKISGSNNSVSANTYYHTVVTRIGGTTTLYVDGVSIGSFSDTNNYSNDFMIIGTDVSEGTSAYCDFLNGAISTIRVYKGKGLTLAEVNQNYNALRWRYEHDNGETASVSNIGDSLYAFTSSYFTVSRALSGVGGTDVHRTGPTQTEVRAWLSGSSNGGGSHSWANTYVDCPVQGYQRWTIPKTGKYTITAKGGSAGYTDDPDDYLRGLKVTADFNLIKNQKLILVAGQGVPDYDGDHCNGGGGASWVMSGSDYTSAIPLIVANGAGGDTSDGTSLAQPNVTLGASITVTPTVGEGGGSAVTGKQTTPYNSTVTVGRGSTATAPPGATTGGPPNSGGWLGSTIDPPDYPGGGDVGANVSGEGFRDGLVGGNRSDNTAGCGGFGGGSGGYDEWGSAGGGFTGAAGGRLTGSAHYELAGHGSSFVNDDNQGNVSVALAQASTTFQNSNYTSEDQYQGWVKIEFVS